MKISKTNIVYNFTCIEEKIGQSIEDNVKARDWLVLPHNFKVLPQSFDQ